VKRAETTAGIRAGTLRAKYDDAGYMTRLLVDRVDCTDANDDPVLDENDNPICLGGSSVDQWYEYVWDELGRLVDAKRWDGGGSFSIDPDTDIDVTTLPPAGNLAAHLSYVYDASDQRILKTAHDVSGQAGSDDLHTVYIFESLELRRTEYDDIANDYEQTPETEVPYLFANGVRLARVHRDATLPQSTTDAQLHVLFELGDHLGSASVVLDKKTSQLVERSTYQA
jgi:hypothetical protein